MFRCQRHCKNCDCIIFEIKLYAVNSVLLLHTATIQRELTAAAGRILHVSPQSRYAKFVKKSHHDGHCKKLEINICLKYVINNLKK